MSSEEEVELGPIDYLLVEWPGKQPNGEALPHLVDLVDRGLIRILDFAFIKKEEDGSVIQLEIADLGDEILVLEGASSGILSDEDTSEAAQALENGTSAALLVYENSWASRFVTAAFRAGGDVIATGRIPAADIIETLEELEAESA